MVMLFPQSSAVPYNLVFNIPCYQLNTKYNCMLVFHTRCSYTFSVEYFVVALAVTLEGASANDTFRGFFVQAKGSDDSQLGQFKAVDEISQTQCGVVM